MDFYINLALGVALQVLKDAKQARRFFPVLAKVYVKVELLAQQDEKLQAEIEHQRRKESVLK